MELIDFSNCEIDQTRMYRGSNGKKLGIKYNDEIYMLKFPSLGKTEDISYSNSSISEYISCHIFESLEIKTQKTILGLFRKDDKEKIACACKDFTTGNNELLEFAQIKNGVLLDSPSNGYGVELNEVLKAIDEQKLLPPNEVKDFFWTLFIVDAFLGNFDRHNGNWGFLVNRDNNKVEIAPVFDCGSCLYPQLTDVLMEEYLNDEDELNKRVYVFPNSALRIDDKKINYFDFISKLENEDCNKALKKIYEKIDMQKIFEIIDETPAISDIRKNFYKMILRKRYQIIICAAVNKLKSLT